EEKVPKLPVHDHRIGERAFLVPSCRVERLDALRRVFETYAHEEVNYSQLARRLNRDKVTAAPHKEWNHERVAYVLQNPVYCLGYRPVGRTPKGQSHRHQVDEHGNRTLTTAPDKDGKKTPRPESEWIKPGAGGAVFEPLISRELFVRVQAKVAAHKTV